MVSVIGHKLQRVLFGFGFVVAQYWVYIILDDFMVTKTMVEMTKCYFKCEQMMFVRCNNEL